MFSSFLQMPTTYKVRYWTGQGAKPDDGFQHNRDSFGNRIWVHWVTVRLSGVPICLNTKINTNETPLVTVLFCQNSSQQYLSFALQHQPAEQRWPPNSPYPQQSKTSLEFFVILETLSQLPQLSLQLLWVRSVRSSRQTEQQPSRATEQDDPGNEREGKPLIQKSQPLLQPKLQPTLQLPQIQ